MVESQREINGKIANETRYDIASLVLVANATGPMIRAHRAFKTSSHWVMDMVFRYGNSACEPTTRQPTLRHAGTSSTILPARRRAGTPYACAAKPQAGTANISGALSQHDFHHPNPPPRESAARHWG